MQEIPYVVYIVECSDGTLYTGVTPHLEERLAAHNAGTGARYTRSRAPVSLLHVEEYPDKGAALKREYALKQLPRAEKFLVIKRAKEAGSTGK